MTRSGEEPLKLCWTVSVSGCLRVRSVGTQPNAEISNVLPGDKRPRLVSSHSILHSAVPETTVLVSGCWTWTAEDVSVSHQTRPKTVIFSDDPEQNPDDLSPSPKPAAAAGSRVSEGMLNLVSAQLLGPVRPMRDTRLSVSGIQPDALEPRTYERTAMVFQEVRSTEPAASSAGKRHAAFRAIGRLNLPAHRPVCLFVCFVLVFVGGEKTTDPPAPQAGGE